MRANDKAIAFGLSFGVLSGFDRIKPGQFHVAYATGNCPRHLDEKESLGVGGTNPEAPVQAVGNFRARDENYAVLRLEGPLFRRHSSATIEGLGL
jgi:hypothetical protein